MCVGDGGQHPHVEEEGDGQLSWLWMLVQQPQRAKDTLHHPEPEEGVVASCRWGWTHHSFLKGEEDTS